MNGTRRRLFVALLVALGLWLTLAARFDPELPFLSGRGGLAWWVHPEPLAIHGGLGPHALTFRFRPQRAGELRIAAMSRFRLMDGAGLLLAGPRPGGNWKGVLRIQVKARDLVVIAEDGRRLPALGLGGEAAPHGVAVEREGRIVAARAAGDLVRVAPSLRGGTRLVAGIALAVGLLGLGFVLARPSRERGEPAATASGGRAILVLAVAGHLAVLACNLERYPAHRGADAEGHIAYAEIIRAEGSLPAPSRGWQTYQPPLYYVLGALALAAGLGAFGMQLVSGLAGLALVLLVARTLGVRGARGVALIAFLPALLVAEPQPVNEVLFALLATAALVVAAGPASGGDGEGTLSARHLLAGGALAGLALLTKYTGLFVTVGVACAALISGGSRGARARAALAATGTALAVGVWPYLERWRLHGDPFVGNWDDALGFPYRQPPGVHTARFFLSFGSALFAHPFRAREASLWDALYVGTVSDGFGRLVATPTQLVLVAVLPWLALPLLAAVLIGAAAIAFGRIASRLETVSLVVAVLVVAALVRYNLELPYGSAAKGVFLLGLVLPGALAFERGRRILVSRGGGWMSQAMDLALVTFVLTSVATLLYRE